MKYIKILSRIRLRFFYFNSFQNNAVGGSLKWLFIADFCTCRHSEVYKKIREFVHSLLMKQNNYKVRIQKCFLIQFSEFKLSYWLKNYVKKNLTIYGRYILFQKSIFKTRNT